MMSSFPISPALALLRDTIVAAGGTPIAVGGCVRDHVLGIAPKDIDIEVYGIALDELESVLKTIGSVFAVGKSFGVLKVVLHQFENATFDVSLPRTENKEGQGHRGFIVQTDSNLSFKQAARRRDFTINAMGVDLSNHQLLDPYNGIDDLKNHILRHVSDAFSEDPLRVLRGCQFVARFSLIMAPETIEKCRELNSELATLPDERIFEEIKKLVMAPEPARGLETLRETQALSLFPELTALIDCKQEAEWHPEGDVWIHTLMAMAQAARLVRRDNLNDDEALIIMLAVLCHDLGKPATTVFEDGRYRSKMHECAGEEPTRSFLKRIGASQSLVEAIVPLVLDHLKPFQLYKDRDKLSDGAIRRLAARVNIQRLCLVNEADSLGRTTENALRGEEPASPWLLEKAKALAVENEAPKPFLLGRHLIEQGIQPGPAMGKILQAAYEAQLDGEFDSLDDALIWLQSHLPRLP